MSQHDDYQIGDQNGSEFLVDINSILQAIYTLNSGNDEPPVTFAYMLWAQGSTDTLWMRNAANSAWINKGSLSAAIGALAFKSTVGAGDIQGGAIEGVSRTYTKGQLATSYDLGSSGAGTVTPKLSDGAIQHLSVTGSFTLAAPSDADQGYTEIEATVDATGGYSLTLSGFSEISGSFDSVAGAVNLIRISKHNTKTYIEFAQGS